MFEVRGNETSAGKRLPPKKLEDRRYKNKRWRQNIPRLFNEESGAELDLRSKKTKNL